MHVFQRACPFLGQMTPGPASAGPVREGLPPNCAYVWILWRTQQDSVCEAVCFFASLCGTAAERRTRYQEVPGSKLTCAIWFFPWARKLNRHCYMGMLFGPCPHHCSPIGRAALHSSVKTSTWCFHWGRKLQFR